MPPELPQPQFALLQFRPHASQSGGLPRTDLTSIANRLGSAQAHESGFATAYSLVSFDEGTDFDDALVELIARRINDALRTAEVIFLDCGFPDRYFARFELHLVRALASLSENLIASEPEVPKMVLILDKIVESGVVMTLHKSVSALAAHLAIVDLSGDMVSASTLQWNVPADMADRFKITPKILRNSLAARLVRRRGVFRARADSNEHLTAFRYYAGTAEVELKTLLSRFAREKGLTGYIYAESAPDWLSRSVRAAAVEIGYIPVFSTRELAEPNSGAALGAATGRQRIGIVVPLYRSGQSLRELQDAAVNSNMRGPFVHLAILADTADEQPQPPREDSAFPLTKMFAGKATTVHFFANVLHRPLQDGDWRISAAQSLNEIEDDSDTWCEPTRTAMWSLFEELSLGDERGPVTYFPRLIDLGAQDATWLAEAMLRVASRELGVDRRQMLAVLPADNSGALHIANALETSLDVAVLRIHRETVRTGQDLSRDRIALIQDYADRHILLLDEAVLSGRTLAWMNNVVSYHRGRGADLMVTVVRAGRPDPDRRARALYSWEPLLVRQ